MMSGIGIGLLFFVFAWYKSLRTVAIAVVTTIIIKVTCAFFIGGIDSIINSSFAVFIEGIAVLCALLYFARKNKSSVIIHSITAVIAMIVAGTLFYVIGRHLRPCNYLQSFGFKDFFLHETGLWAVFSAITAPLGYQAGKKFNEYLSTVGAERLTQCDSTTMP